MKCRCGGDTFVTDTRAVPDVNGIRRRRECESCGRRITTYETTRAPHQIRWATKNREKSTAYVKAWREANPERIRRIRLREEARKQAAATGRKVADVYKAYGCE